MPFTNLIQSYPVFIYTILLGVVLVYWLLAMVGMLDFEHGGPDLSIDSGDMGDVSADMSHGLNAHAGSDASGAHDPGTLASWLVAFGLGGVPFSVVVSLLMLFAWVICSIASAWILPFVPTILLNLVVGTALLIGSFACAIPLSAVCVRPMRKLFVTHTAPSHISLVGMECVIRSESVNEHSGFARAVSANGNEYDIKVVMQSQNNLKYGDAAVIVEYDEDIDVFHIAEKSEY